jgi:hypothetical protein
MLRFLKKENKNFIKMGTGPIFAGKRTVTYRGQKIKKWGLSPF